MTTITHDGTSIPLAPIKDPDSVVDYGFDWENWLDTENTETISTSTWILPTDLTEVNSSTVGYKTTVLLSGGNVGQTYTITNRITTSASRTEDRSMTIPVREL